METIDTMFYGEFIKVRIPKKFCANNIFNMGLTPMFYIVYVEIAAKGRDYIETTVGEILDERGKKYELRKNRLFKEVVESLSYMDDAGMISIEESLDDIGFNTLLHIDVTDDILDVTSDYYSLKYSDYRKIVRSCHLKNPEYAIMLYVYIACHIYNRPDYGHQSFYESREHTCQKLGISRYRYDAYTDFLDECQVITKWRSDVFYRRNDHVVHVPNIYTLCKKDSIDIYWQSLKDITGIKDERFLANLVSVSRDRRKIGDILD